METNILSTIRRLLSTLAIFSLSLILTPFQCTEKRANDVASNILNLTRASSRAIKNCSGLSEDQKSICNGFVNRTLSHISNLENLFEARIQKLDSNLSRNKKSISEYQRKCESGEKEACKMLILLTSSTRQIKVAIEQTKLTASRNYDAAMSRFLNAEKLIKESNSKYVAIVKLRPTGIVRVIPVSSLLSYYDDYMVNSILEDLSSLAFKLDSKAETALVSCPNGQWVAYPESAWNKIKKKFDKQAKAIEQLATDQTINELLNLCGNINVNSAGGGSGDGGSMSGFTGVSGIDPMGSLSCMSGSTGMGTDKIMADMEKKIADMQKTCGDDFSGRGGIMEDGAAPAGTTPTKTETTTTTETDEDGNTTTTTTTTTTNSDGSITKTTVVTDSNGNVVHKGTMTKTDTDGDGTLDKTVSNIATPGTNGDVHHDVIINDKNGMDWHSYTTKSGDWRIHDQKQIAHFKFKSCVDETCANCQSAAQAASVMAMKCAGSSYGICQQYAKANSCCGGKEGFMDPTVAMPTPDGSFACVTSSSSEAAEDMCRKKCSVASDLNCEERCNSQRRGQPPFDVADRICQYAYSEDCFSSDIDFPMPGPRRSGPVPEPPVPNLYSNHLLFTDMPNCNQVNGNCMSL